MKGYKGFSKGLVCRGKQYAENAVFEEESAKICESGMHFCKNPLEVWRYYPPCDNNGEVNEFAEVESLTEAYTDDGKKYCTTKLKVGRKIGLSEFIELGVASLVKDEKSDKVVDARDFSAATNTGYYSVATNAGYYSAATNAGYYSAATNTGYRSVATNTGYRSVATNTGDYSAATNTGNYSVATNAGDCSAATNIGNCSAAISMGINSTASVGGKSSIAIATGLNNRVRGGIGCWLVCAEHNEIGEVICVESVKVDGKVIKEGVFYKLKNGVFVEAGDSEAS